VVIDEGDLDLVEPISEPTKEPIGTGGARLRFCFHTRVDRVPESDTWRSTAAADRG